MATLLGIGSTNFSLTGVCQERGNIPVSTEEATALAPADQTSIQALNDLIGLIEVVNILGILAADSRVANLETSLTSAARIRLASELVNVDGETAFEKHIQGIQILLNLSGLPGTDRPLLEAALTAYQEASDAIDDIHFSDERFRALLTIEAGARITDITLIGVARTLAALELLIGDVRQELDIAEGTTLDQLRSQVGDLCRPEEAAPNASPPPQVTSAPVPDSAVIAADQETPAEAETSWYGEHFIFAAGANGPVRVSFTDQAERLAAEFQPMVDLWGILGYRHPRFSVAGFARYGFSAGPDANDDSYGYNRYSYSYFGARFGLELGRLELSLQGGWLASLDLRRDDNLEIRETREANLGVVELGANVCVAECAENEASEGRVYASAGVMFDRDYEGFFARAGFSWLTEHWLRFDAHILYGNAAGNRVGVGLGLDLRLGSEQLRQNGFEFLLGLYGEGGWQDVGGANEGVINAGIRLIIGNPYVREPLSPAEMGF